MTEHTLLLSRDAAYALALSRLGTLARRNGNPAQALALRSRALLLLRPQLQSRQFRALRPLVLCTLLELARDQAQFGRCIDSRITLVEVVHALDAGFPEDFPELIDAYFELAARTSARAEVRRLLECGTQLRVRLYGPDDPRTHEALQRLAQG